MRHHPVNIILVQTITPADVLDRARHIEHRMLVDRTSLLIDSMFESVHGGVSRHLCRATSLHAKILQSLTIDMINTIYQTHLLRRSLNHHRRCAIAKDRTSVAVSIVSHRRHMVAADEHDTLVAA